MLLVAETAQLGHNVRSLEVDGHRAIIQHPLWHFAWNGGGNWAKVIREQNLGATVHVSPHPLFTVRGSDAVVELPVMMSAKATCAAVLKLLPFEVDAATTADVERVIYEGLAITAEDLFAMHDVSLMSWLDEVNAGDVTRAVIIQLGAAFAGLPASIVAENFSVFGVFVHIRVFISGEGLPVFIAPDAQHGLIVPLADRVVAMGGTVWKGTQVEQVLIVDGRASGVRMKDGREAYGRHVAIAVGNPRIPRIISPLPAELEAPLTKEAALAQSDLCTVSVLDKPVTDLTTYLVVSDPTTGANLWFVPLHSMAPWNCPDDRQLCLTWVSGALNPDGTPMNNLEDLERYTDEVFEDRWPGWTDAVGGRKHISHAHHWMNPCYTGEKIGRRSSTVSNLWYVGEGTAPVAGIGLEQAAYAAYEGALAIASELGLGGVLRERVFTAAQP